MRQLLWKDLIFSKYTLLIFLPMISLLVPLYTTRGLPAGIFVAFVALMTAFIPLSLLAQEDRFRSLILTCSLPVTRPMIVRAKFVGGWIMALAVCLYGLFLGLLLPGSKLTMEEVFTVRNVFVILTLITLALAFLMPFTLRYGFVGMMVLLIGFQLLGVLLMLSTATGLTGISLRTLIPATRETMTSWHSQLGATLFYTLYLLVLVGLNAGSCRLTQSVFQRRDF